MPCKGVCSAASLENTEADKGKEKGMKTIAALIEQNKKNFIFYNITRLREMLRYMAPQKLILFKEIPFLIHINDPGFPGYIPTLHQHPGLWHFETSGLARDLCDSNIRIKKLLASPHPAPAVEGLYHIGSLGTFTQSEKSDFDFWVLIDPTRLQGDQIKAFREKLHQISLYARNNFSQEVTFFVHSAARLQNNLIDETNHPGENVPALLLKEEFYRTFLMIAGKIPLWAIEDSSLNPDQKTALAQQALAQEGFVDLGSLETLPQEEIQRGLLWQICKSPEDPVKALIKASITASYLEKGLPGKNPLPLCNQLRENFKSSRIDDYGTDPYVLAFERALDFHARRSDSLGLAEIKSAIFFRLCGFPQVSLPETGSPKRTLLNHYVRKWRLDTTQLHKLIAYPQWSENEKRLFDQALLKRLGILYQGLLGRTCQGQKNFPEDETEEWGNRILKNKARSILLAGSEGRIPPSSLFLRRRPHAHLMLAYKAGNTPPQDSGKWFLFSGGDGQKNLLFSSPHVLQVLGWCMANAIYTPRSSQMSLHADTRLFDALGNRASFETLYLALQAWMPLSDEVFISAPSWERILVLLSTDPTDTEKTSLLSAQFLARNSWGEIFFENLSLSHLPTLQNQCCHIAEKIRSFHDEPPVYTLFQMARTPIPLLIQNIKTLVEDARFLKEGMREPELRKKIRIDLL